MFFSPFITGLLPILASSTQIESPQHPSIFILSDQAASTSALGNALQTLGYTYISAETLNSSTLQPSSHTFTELPTHAASSELVMIQYPHTKIIVPISPSRKGKEEIRDAKTRPCANRWLTHLATWSQISLLSPPKSTSTSKITPMEEDANETAQNEQLKALKSALEKEGRGRLLEISLDEREKHRGDKWLRLCEFLDLGYSVVERLNLKEFPSSSAGQERKTLGWGGNFGMWGLVMQGSGV
ncbi:hypothetical protein NHQ30_000616 [Ciborinia camelliae]|nr:hypothetical protein NHQ30_000616 [Ciborinia camelliae]